MSDRTPTTEAGRRLDEDAVRLWYQPDDPKAPYQDPRSHSQSATFDVRAAILAIEDEARAPLERELKQVHEQAAEWAVALDDCIRSREDRP